MHTHTGSHTHTHTLTHDLSSPALSHWPRFFPLLLRNRQSLRMCVRTHRSTTIDASALGVNYDVPTPSLRSGGGGPSGVGRPVLSVGRTGRRETTAPRAISPLVPKVQKLNSINYSLTDFCWPNLYRKIVYFDTHYCEFWRLVGLKGQRCKP